jgi:hypothetical protein
MFTACLWDLTDRKQARAEQQAPGKRLRQSERLQSLGSRPGAWRTTSTTCSGSPCTTPLSSCSASPTTRPPAPTPNRSGPPPSRARCNPRVLAGLSAVQTAGRLGNPASPPPGQETAWPARSSWPSTRYSTARCPPRAHAAGPPRSHRPHRARQPRTRGLPGKRGAGKRLGAVDATGGTHRSLWGVFLSVRCLAPTPGGRARTGPRGGRDAGRPRGRSWCAGRRRAC